jgi:ubiquinone/menaquinone biosynthesis C-methylase UbiE
VSYPAESYENLMVPGLFAPWASRLIQSANLQPGERVLDVACGTGIVARQVAYRIGSRGSVTGLDIDLTKINVARAAAKREGLTIEWHMGPAEQLPFPDHHFDLVFCQFGLMFFSNRHAALTEMHRVLRTGGRVALSVWQSLEREPFYQTLDEVSRRYLGKSSVGAVFSLGDSAEVNRLIVDAGFQDVEIESVEMTASFPNPQEFLAWELDIDPAETPALQNLDSAAQQQILAALHEEMQAPLQEVTQGDEVVMPSHAYIAHAKR